MVLQEIEHVLANIINGLPLLGDTFDRPVFASDTAKIVIHAHFIVEIVKASCNVSTVEVRVVHLGDKEYVGILFFDLCNSPGPEGLWHHLCHIAAETIDAFTCPEEQYVQHLVPCVRDWIKLLFATILVEDTIVEFDGLIPVVLRRVGSKAVIASSASWVFGISL